METKNILKSLKVKPVYLLICLGIALSACKSDGVGKPDYQEDDYVVSMLAEFDVAKDMNPFDLFCHEDNCVLDPNENKASYVDDGWVVFENDGVAGLDLKPQVNHGTAVHVRWKLASDEDVCQGLRFWWPNDSGQDGIGLGSCSYRSLELGVITDEPIDYTLPFLLDGGIILEPDKIMDTLIWVEAGSPAELRVFAWESDHPDIYFVEKMLLEGWPTVSGLNFSMEVFEGSIALDRFELISGDIESYLWFNAPAFEKFHESVFGVLHGEPIEPIGVPEAQEASAEPETETVAEAETEVDPEDGGEESATPESEVTESETADAAEEHSEPLLLEDHALMRILQTAMLNAADLPEENGFELVAQDYFDAGDSLRLSKSFLEIPTTESEGLWITNVLTLQEEPITSVYGLMEMVAFGPETDMLHTGAPAVGEVSLSFSRSHYKRYLTVQGSFTLDLQCHSLYSGLHPFCSAETLAALAETMLARLPQDVQKPPELRINVPPEGEDQYFDFIHLETAQMNLYWQASVSLPSMAIVVHDEDSGKDIYCSEVIDIAETAAGEERSIHFEPGIQDDAISLPPGKYILYVIVAEETMPQFQFEIGS